jgi:hypothetical protein
MERSPTNPPTPRLPRKSWRCAPAQILFSTFCLLNIVSYQTAKCDLAKALADLQTARDSVELLSRELVSTKVPPSSFPAPRLLCTFTPHSLPPSRICSLQSVDPYVLTPLSQTSLRIEMDNSSALNAAHAQVQSFDFRTRIPFARRTNTPPARSSRLCPPS